MMADDLIRELLRRRIESFEKEFNRSLSEAYEKAIEKGNTEESPIFGRIDRRNNG
jgi:predicted component of type VI protein secretion system